MTRNKSERGAALIEAAVTLPMLLLVAVGIFEFGRAYQTWQVLTNAAREGTRIAILTEKTDADVKSAVQNYMKNGGLPKYLSATVTIDRNLPMGPNTASQVTVGYPFQFMVLNGVIRLITPSSKTGSPFTMQSVALMRNES